jgi:hypothetical protein
MSTTNQTAMMTNDRHTVALTTCLPSHLRREAEGGPAFGLPQALIPRRPDENFSRNTGTSAFRVALACDRNVRAHTGTAIANHCAKLRFKVEVANLNDKKNIRRAVNNKEQLGQ